MMMCVLAVLGAKAAPVNWSYTVEVDGENVTYTGKYDILADKVKIEVDQPGGLAVFLQNGGSVLEGVSPTKLEIGKPGGCQLNSEDFSALNSTNVPALAHFTTVDLKETTIDGFSIMTGMSLSNLEYLNLPGTMTDVTEMAKLNSGNPSLKMVVSCDATIANIKKSYAYSFTPNSMLGAFTALGLEDFRNAKYVTMAGYYGDRDLVGASDGSNFKNSPAVWDFTGAHFSDITISGSSLPGNTYYDYNNPFEDETVGSKVTFGETYQTNSFYYFVNYATTVVDIKLPDNNMTALPPHCLSQLAAANKENYKLIYGTSEDEFNQSFGAVSTVKKYYESGTDTEFTGERYQEGDNWKGKKQIECQVTLDSPSSSSSVYVNTWADNKEYVVGDLTITDGKVTPSEFAVKLANVSWYTNEERTNQVWPNMEHFGKDDTGYYYKDWDGGEKKYIYPKAQYQDQTDWQYKDYTGELNKDGNDFYGTISNPGSVSFTALTNYYYTYNDCNNIETTLKTSDGNLAGTEYTANGVEIIDLEERDVDSYGVASCAPVELLVIPNCYELIDFECAKWGHIQSILVGNGMKKIQGGAFTQCAGLENLDFVSGLSDCYLGSGAFSLCESMKHIALAEGIVSLGASCFDKSMHLESVRLPESLINIGNLAFNNCLALNSITIPKNVEKIGKKAFNLCPLTDVYLTTTDPDKIPIIYSCGTSFNSYDGNATFAHGHLDGWDGLPESYQDKMNVQQYDWDHAVDWYYTHCNGLPVLHYPNELYEVVRARISRTYHAKSTDGYGLPMAQDMKKRSDVYGADLGSVGSGKYTRDGWAQFMLMKDYNPEGEEIVYSKEYNDVWYTMCFPFDLTDEQLAAAFNETFNIVDFSGVEITEATETDPKSMILHFNKVAVTYYKDVNETIYKRKLDADGNVIREKHGNFSYNVYLDNSGNEYHHVHASDKLSSNKTKTFAKGTSLENAASNFSSTKEVYMIDGILATAGHPYMIHPAVGAEPGNPKKACYMAGITWKPEEEREAIYNRETRTIDLGVSSTSEEKEHNYNQVGYTGYSGQTYSFKGNWKRYNSGWESDPEIGAEPQLTVKEPVLRTRPTSDPVAPNFPNPGEEPVQSDYNPVEDLTTYPAAFQTMYNTLLDMYYEDNTYTIDPYENRFGPGQVNYDVKIGYIMRYVDSSKWQIFKDRSNALKAYLGSDFTQDQFVSLKELCIAFGEAYDKYFNVELLHEDWVAWQNYLQKKADYDNWDADQVQAEYDAAKAAYDAAKTEYDTKHGAWESKMIAYNVLIPKYAYFLGTKAGEKYPRYFRQMADESKPRAKGLWTQYAAIIIPNSSAISGLETELDGTTQKNLGAKIVYDEAFFVLDDPTPQGIATIIEKAAKEEGKANVEYMDIVVSIDGKIVSRDKTTFEGLPKGVYIINGKKYFVQ